MFEIGKSYRLSMTDPSDPDAVHYVHGSVVEFQFPLLKIRDDGKEKIINTSSPTFMSAERIR
jgi:hypothetical protein